MEKYKYRVLVARIVMRIAHDRALTMMGVGTGDGTGYTRREVEDAIHGGCMCHKFGKCNGKCFDCSIPMDEILQKVDWCLQNMGELGGMKCNSKNDKN